MRYIYLLKDPINKKVVYVGQTSNLKIRYNQHKWGCQKDSIEKKEWCNNLKKQNLNPIMEIIAEIKDKKEATLFENLEIIKYAKNGNKLFNQNFINTIKMYSEKGELINEFANCDIAKKITGIRPRLDRYSCKGYYWSYGEFDENAVFNKEYAKKIKCKPVMQFDKNGNFIREYDGVRIACKITGIDHRSISAVAGGSKIRKTAGGYIWIYKK